MTDIVERLENHNREALLGQTIYRDATREIEALRAENARLLDCYKGSTYTVDVLIKDNARLREAGKEVVDWWLRDGVNKFDGDQRPMFNLRAALGDE